MATQEPLVFTVTRRSPELVTPAKPTPNEYKLVVDIDDQKSLRFHVTFVQFYNKKNNFVDVRQEMDPVKVIRNALAKTLVFYYPLAGRLREGADGKLGVECTGKGVLFVEADADITLVQFGDALHPPFPCLEELLVNVTGSCGVLDSPLLLIQVTRLKCGGFIFALCFNHIMSDAAGVVQFMTALSEIARGASIPSILPVWEENYLMQEIHLVLHAHIMRMMMSWLTPRDPPSFLQVMTWSVVRFSTTRKKSYNISFRPMSKYFTTDVFACVEKGLDL